LVAGLIAATRLIPSPQPVEPPKPPDLFATCGAAARELLADELEEFAEQRFDSEQAKEDAINEKIHDVIESSFVPLSEQVAKAIKANRLTEYARKIKAGEADEQ
jgi:beta-lactamase class D